MSLGFPHLFCLHKGRWGFQDLGTHAYEILEHSHLLFKRVMQATRGQHVEGDWFLFSGKLRRNEETGADNREMVIGG